MARVRYLILLSQFAVLKRQFPNKFIFCLQHAFFYYRTMEEIILRFPHLAEKIFEKLTNEGLAKSREVERLWQKFIDEKNYLWLRIVNIPTILQEGNSYMHLAARYGQMDMFEMILKGYLSLNQSILKLSLFPSVLFHKNIFNLHICGGL